MFAFLFLWMGVKILISWMRMKLFQEDEINSGVYGLNGRPSNELSAASTTLPSTPPPSEYSQISRDPTMVAGRLTPPDAVYSTDDNEKPEVGRRYLDEDDEGSFEEKERAVGDGSAKEIGEKKDGDKKGILDPVEAGISEVTVAKIQSEESEETKYLTLHIHSECLGKGGFGQVNIGNLESRNEKVAVKFEKQKPEEDPSIRLEHECTIHRELKCPGLPSLYACGYDKGYYFMVMEKLGQNLTKKKDDISKAKHSCKVAADIAIKAIKILEAVHEGGYVHGDVKPDNFVYGSDNKTDDLFLIDVGLAVKIEPREYDQQMRNFRGTRQYASVHAHLGKKGSKRDDLESLAYTLLSLVSGCLPWKEYEGIQKTDGEKTKAKKNFHTCKMKMVYSPKKLSMCWPKCCRCYFKQFLDSVLNLGFMDDPKYKDYIVLFSSIPENGSCGMIEKTRWLKENVPPRQYISVYEDRPVSKQRYHYNVSVDPKMLPQYTEKGRNDGLFIRHVASAGDNWVLIMEEGTQYKDQVCKVLKLHDKSWIEEHWGKSYYISALAGLRNGNFLVVMSKGDGFSYTDQYIETSECFPESWLQKGWENGYCATALAHAGKPEASSENTEITAENPDPYSQSQWAVVMSQDANSSDIEQAVVIDFGFNAEGLHYRWESDYRITIAAATDDQVAFVLDHHKKDNKLNSRKQVVHLTSSFPSATIKENWSRASYVTSLCYGRTYI